MAGVQDLYVLTSAAFPGLLKVGRSNWPERRVLDLSHGQPVHYELRLVVHGAGELEPRVHHLLAFARHEEGHSREWFRCSPDDVLDAVRLLDPAALEQLEWRGAVEVSDVTAESLAAEDGPDAQFFRAVGALDAFACGR